MKKFLKKDKKNRKLVLIKETTKFILKSIIKNMNFTSMLKWNANLKLNTFSKNSSKIYLVNKCIVTGDKSKINKKYKFSRIFFLKYIRSGNITGIKKSGW